MTSSRAPMRHFGLFTFIILTWGLAWPINKMGLEFMSPLWYSAIRLIIGTVIMMMLVMALRKFSWPNWRDIPLILIIGILQISLYLFLANLGLAYLPAGRSSLLAYTTPLWVMPAAIILFGEKPTRLKWFGFSVSLLGLIVLLSPWDFDWGNPSVIFGAAMLLLASLSWAISMLCVRYMRWYKTPLELMPWQLLIGTLPVLLFALIKEPHLSFQWNTTLVLSLLYTGVLVTGFSYWSGVVINRELPTIVVSLGFLAVPVFSVIVSAIFMHESIHFATASAMMLILTGLACVVI